MIEKKKKFDATLTPTEAILESISDGVFTVDSEWRVTSFNRAAEEITGVPRREAIGRRCSEVFRSSNLRGGLRPAENPENGQARHWPVRIHYQRRRRPHPHQRCPRLFCGMPPAG